MADTEYIKVSGKTVEDAVLEASIQLGTTSDNIEYTVIERESKGFLGIGAKKATIEARRKKSEEDLVSEAFEEMHGTAGKGSGKGSSDGEKKKKDKKDKKDEKKSGKKDEKKDEKKAAKKAEKAEDASGKKAEKADKKDEKKAAKKAEKAEKSEKAVKGEAPAPDKAEAPAAEAAETAPAAEETAVAEKEEHERAPRVPADPQVVQDRARTFLGDLLGAMGVEAAISMTYEEGVLNIDLEGEDMGILIGKRGQTLDSIQYLTSLVVNKGKAAYVRVKIDTENYRERRKATLENLAKNMAFKVKKTRRPAYLEPMNPYERRIIHSALQDDPYVTTHSEGEEPLRKVVITLKKRDMDVPFEEEEE